MSQDERESADETRPLLPLPRTHSLDYFYEHTPIRSHFRSLSFDISSRHNASSTSLSSLAFAKEEQVLAGTVVGERLPYNDYTTIDWLHDLVKDSYQHRLIHSGKSIRKRLLAKFDSASGWVAVTLMGILTACVGFLVDRSVATVNDWKFGYCQRNPFLPRKSCCAQEATSAVHLNAIHEIECPAFHTWAENWWVAFVAYGGFALLFGVISGGLTLTTKAYLPAAAPGLGDTDVHAPGGSKTAERPHGKSMYMAAGSGIPELKTFLSGFAFPHFLTFKVLVVKAVGCVFAVTTGLSLGKEGPFVHISAIIGSLVANRFPRYRHNQRKYREILSASVAAGISAAFGTPIGGVLFAYEEVATYFPRKVLWRAFLCSIATSVLLKSFNPTGTGKLILFETNFATRYSIIHYLVFAFLGVAGGVWGGMFLKMNWMWSRWFRNFRIIKEYPVFEVFLVVLATVLLSYPNPLTRISGDEIIKFNLVDCKEAASAASWICQNEKRTDGRWDYVGWLIHGCVSKLILTTIAFGIKVPSGIIIPAMGAGSFFGRLVGQWVGTISPGIFAMVGAGAFLAGVSKMTISLCVVMFELTGEREYILPHMIAILIAKWVSDKLSPEGVYDLAQSILGHPFLDPDHALRLVQRQDPPHHLRDVLPQPKTMNEMKVHIGQDGYVDRRILETKLDQLRARGLQDSGLVLLRNGMLQGYLAQGELEFGLEELGQLYPKESRVALMGGTPVVVRDHEDLRDEEGGALLSDSMIHSEELDLSSFVDRTPMTMCEAAPMEVVVECFGKLGLRHLLVLEEGTGRCIGVVVKKRLLAYLQKLH